MRVDGKADGREKRRLDKVSLSEGARVTSQQLHFDLIGARTENARACLNPRRQ